MGGGGGGREEREKSDLMFVLGPVLVALTVAGLFEVARPLTGAVSHYHSPSRPLLHFTGAPAC